MDKALKFLGIGALVWLVLKNIGNSIVSKLSLSKVKIQNVNINLQGVSFKIIASVQNNSQISLPLQDFKGFVMYGQSVLTEVTLGSPEIIAAQSIVDIPFNSHIPINQLSNTIISMIESGQWLNSLYLEGTIYSEGISIPVSKAIISV